MRKIKRKNRQVKMVVYSLIGCFLFMGIGYSVLTTNLNFQVHANKSKRDRLVEVLEDKNIASNSEGLITDDFSNIRYAGSNVKNYIKFNGETWRIIGVFDGKTKIIRNEILPVERPWNNVTGGLNDWKTSTIAEYLNGTYYNSINSTYRNMVTTVTYYLGGWSSNEITKKEMYQKERGSLLPSCTVGTNSETSATCPRKATWDGKVGLMYPSDYGYAASSLCNTNLINYNITQCTSNNWLYLENKLQWFITPYSNTVVHAWLTLSTGGVEDGYNTAGAHAIRPTLYLDSMVKVVSGNGSSTSPYQISM